MSTKFSDPDFLKFFFDKVVYRSWGIFFPYLTPASKETSELDAINLVQELGLIPTARDIEERRIQCDHVDEEGLQTGLVTASRNSRTKFGLEIRCQQQACRSSKRKSMELRKRKVPSWLKTSCVSVLSITEGTWFSHQKLYVQDNLFIVFVWVCRMPVSVAIEQCEIGSKTAVDWFSFCHEVAEIIFSNDAENCQIGGDGFIVEVDETYLKRRKYDRGNALAGESITVFGMYCRETKEGVFLKVKDKSRAVLWAQMAKYIRPGSRIVTDGAVMYRNCDAALGFSEHMVVVHQIEFVNSQNPEAHTNSVEVRNRWVKAQVKSHRTDRQLSSYMAEYWYRVKYFKDQDSRWRKPGQNFKRFLEDVKKCYPGAGKEGLKLIEIGVTQEEMDQLPDGEFQVGIPVLNPDGGQPLLDFSEDGDEV